MALTNVTVPALQVTGRFLCFSARVYFTVPLSGGSDVTVVQAESTNFSDFGSTTTKVDYVAATNTFNMYAADNTSIASGTLTPGATYRINIYLTGGEFQSSSSNIDIFVGEAEGTPFASASDSFYFFAPPVSDVTLQVDDGALTNLSVLAGTDSAKLTDGLIRPVAFDPLPPTYPPAPAPPESAFEPAITPAPDHPSVSLERMNFTVYFEPTVEELAQRTLPLVQTLDAAGDGEIYWLDTWNNTLIGAAYTAASGVGETLYSVELNKPLVAGAIYRFQGWETGTFEPSPSPLGTRELLIADQWWVAKHDQSSDSHHFYGVVGTTQGTEYTQIRLASNVFQEFYRYRTRSLAWPRPDYRVAFSDTSSNAYSADFYFLAGDSTEERAEAWVVLESDYPENEIRTRVWQRTHNDDNLIQVIAHNSAGSTGGLNQYVGTTPLSSGDVVRVHMRNEFLNVHDPKVTVWVKNYDNTAYNGGAPNDSATMTMVSTTNITAPWSGWTFSAQWIMPFRDGEDRYRPQVQVWADFDQLTYTFTDYDALMATAIVEPFGVIGGIESNAGLLASADVVLGAELESKVNETRRPHIGHFTGTTTESI